MGNMIELFDKLRDIHNCIISLNHAIAIGSPYRADLLKERKIASALFKEQLNNLVDISVNYFDSHMREQKSYQEKRNNDLMSSIRLFSKINNRLMAINE